MFRPGFGPADDTRSEMTTLQSEISVAGAAWPVYKVIALVASLLTAVMVGLATQDAELTTWLVVAVAVSTWWGARAVLSRR